MDDATTRRRYLAAIGALGATGTAGCSGVGLGGDGGDVGATPAEDGSDSGATPTGGGSDGDAGTTGGVDTESGGTSTATTTPIEGALDGWPLPGHDAGNTLYAPEEAAPTGDASKRWQSEVTGRSRGVAVAGGTIYVAPHGGSKGPQNYVLAVDAATGAERWRTSLTGKMPTTPTVAGDTVLVGNGYGAKGKHQVYALSAADGSVRWQQSVMARQPVVPDGDTAFVAHTQLRALDLASGDVKWTYSPGGNNWSPSRPVVGDGRVYVAAGNRIRALSLEGKGQWAVKKAGVEYGVRDLAFADGTLYVTGESKSRTVLAVSAADGATEWSRSFDAEQIGTYGPGSVAVTDGEVFVGLESGGEQGGASVVSLARADGSVRWRKPFAGRVPALAVAGDTVVAGGSDTDPYQGPNNGALAAYARSDGSQRWQVATRARGPTPAVVDGAVFANGFFETGENDPGKTVLFALTD